ncbi:propanediol utilization protein [Actibacterium sp. MT2.3-13A]|uniref:propanediol utilization protein n=1 Tax=Actibacterium sp. MT2.3-13A TaxID=2828332 RepID=UPI0032C23D12
MSATRTTVTGHFGELLQGRMGASGPLALVTLPCAALRVTATGHPARGLHVHSPDRLLSPALGRLFLTRIGVAARGRFALRADMPAGGGAGASTAALLALARLAAPQTRTADLARACLAIEGATDPLMFARPERLLWASRRAETLQVLPALPRFEVLGGFFGAHRRTDPTDHAFPDIGDLVPLWRDAAAAGDLAALARLASRSARRTLALRGPQDDPTEALARDLGALGFVIAHTGSARGLIFAPGHVPADGAERLRAARFTQVLHFRAGGRA